MAEYKLDDKSGTTLTLLLFSDVNNSKELLDYMQAGTLDPELAFFNALLIPHVFPVLAAAHKSLLAKCRGRLTTRTLHSELVYNYSGSKHITESLKRCGINDSTTYVLVARFNATLDEVTIQVLLTVGPWTQNLVGCSPKEGSLYEEYALNVGCCTIFYIKTVGGYKEADSWNGNKFVGVANKS